MTEQYIDSTARSHVETPCGIDGVVVTFKDARVARFIWACNNFLWVVFLEPRSIRLCATRPNRGQLCGGVSTYRS